jgi:micrococcal nuclease
MYEYNCKIVKVVDGDTVDVDIDLGFGVWMKNERVRLYGIDAPESRTRDKEEKKYGLASKKYVQDHMPVNSKQTLRTIKDNVGKFGRVLGVFVLPEHNNQRLDEMMIKNHHAVEYYGQSKEEIKEQHVKNREYVTILEDIHNPNYIR